MATDVCDERREVAAFCEELVRDVDRRLARIELTMPDTYQSVPAWQHLSLRRAFFLRLQAEAYRRKYGSGVDRPDSGSGGSVRTHPQR